VGPLVTALLMTHGYAELSEVLAGGAADTLPAHLAAPAARALLVADAPARALPLLLRHLAEHPDDAPAWVDLARAQLLLDDPERAGQALLEALAHDPGHGRALLLLGHVRLRGGDLVRARRCYESALANGVTAGEVAPLLAGLEAAVRGAPHGAGGAAP